MEGFNAGTITIVLSIFGMGILVMLFQWRQNVVLERRLREDIDGVREDARKAEERLREDIDGVREDARKAEERLREDAKATEERLRSEMKDSEERLREDIDGVREDARKAEERLREDAKATEERLRSEMKDSEERLRSEMKDSEERLRGEIQAVAASIEKVETSLNHRLDRADDNVNALTQAVGVVQGAVVGVSIETPRRETAVPN